MCTYLDRQLGRLLEALETSDLRDSTRIIYTSDHGESLGAEPSAEDGSLPGRSLWGMANEPDRDRFVLSEYHAVGSLHGAFMLRDLRYKYIHYLNAAPQLFDLEQDPDEVRDLAASRGAFDNSPVPGEAPKFHL